MKLWESLASRPQRHAPSLRHEFVIGPLCDSELFPRKARLYYCVRCKWHFLVCEKTVVVLDGYGHPMAGPDSSTRFATFAEGPCPPLAELESHYSNEAYIVNSKPGGTPMNEALWLPATFLLGLVGLGLCFAFLVACEKI
ncbi:hypothetical protein [Candidatus Binatus sp.]|jgi:hypothetical protein|uniref:hypothetical protein n=1 Tax=Candidatus Binatus sp. TaxID=2811406 RepID=UPI003CB81F97